MILNVYHSDPLSNCSLHLPKPAAPSSCLFLSLGRTKTGMASTIFIKCILLQLSWNVCKVPEEIHFIIQDIHKFDSG